MFTYSDQGWYTTCSCVCALSVFIWGKWGILQFNGGEVGWVGEGIHWAGSQKIWIRIPFSHTLMVFELVHITSPLWALAWCVRSFLVLIDYGLTGSMSWCLFFHRAVASLNTPFMPANPNVSLMEIIKANPAFNYQLYFQEPVSLRPWDQRPQQGIFLLSPFSPLPIGLMYLCPL